MSKKCSKKEIEDIVLKAQKQDEQAFEKLYQLYYDSIYYFALKLTHNEADAKDITQETFLQAHTSLPSLNDVRFFKAWLNRIAFSKATRLFNRNKYMHLHDDSYLEDQLIDNQRDHNPQDEMRFHNDKEVLEYFITKLPLEHQAVLFLMYYEQMTMQEIAISLNIPMGTVKSRLHVAKKRLLEAIQQYEIDQGVSLDFHMEALPIIFAPYANKEIMNQLSKKGIKKGKQLISKIGSMSSLKIAVTSCLVLGTSSVYAWYKENTEVQSSNQTALMQQSNTMSKLYPFPETMYEGNSYVRADDAYYALLQFAHCEQEMQLKSKDELQAILPLYTALKEYGSIYYDKLQELGWTKMFENKLTL